MRNRNGQFAKGTSGNPKGRPPRRYSVTHALSEAADQPASVDDEGQPLTNAQVTAQWLWQIISTGKDRGQAVNVRERLEALKAYLSWSDPVAQWEQHGGDDDEQNQELERQLKDLTDEELAVLEKLGPLQDGADTLGLRNLE